MEIVLPKRKEMLLGQKQGAKWRQNGERLWIYPLCEARRRAQGETTASKLKLFSLKDFVLI
jgi:hypothetical protein